jgi:hypothetical protein
MNDTTGDATGPDQLRLPLSVEPEPGWRLDQRTRQIGRRGVAAARALLTPAPAAAPPSGPDDGAPRHRPFEDAA